MDTVEWTEPEVGIAALSEPVAGATAEIITAWLPSCSEAGRVAQVWLDFRNTSSETIRVRPHVYYIGWADHGFSGRELEPGQSYKDKYGYYWLGGTTPSVRPERVEAGIDVYTPEGWVEVDRAVGEPFEFGLCLPELTIISAPEYALPGTEVAITFELYNPGYTADPVAYALIEGIERFPFAFPIKYTFVPPDQSTPFTYTFIMGDEDMTITLTPHRNHPPPPNPDLAGEPVSITIIKEAKMYTDIQIDAPDSALEGDEVNVVIKVTNLTAAALNIDVGGVTEPPDGLFVGFETRLIQPGVTETFSGSFLMHDYDVTIRAYSYFQNILDNEAEAVVSLKEVKEAAIWPFVVGGLGLLGIVLVARKMKVK